MVILWPTEVTVEHEHFEIVVILCLQLMFEILHFNEVFYEQLIFYILVKIIIFLQLTLLIPFIEAFKVIVISRDKVNLSFKYVIFVFSNKGTSFGVLTVFTT